MDADTLNLAFRGLSVFSTVCGVLAMLYAWVTSRSKANSATINVLRDELKESRERLAMIEERMKDIGEWKKDIQHIHQRVDAISKTTNNLNGQMSQINQHLIIIQRALTRSPE